MLFQPHYYPKQSITPNEKNREQRFSVRHQFHPLFGREFDLVQYYRCWGEDRVYYINDEGVLKSIEARWTDAAAPDEFVVASATRSRLRASDLLELVKLVKGLK